MCLIDNVSQLPICMKRFWFSEWVGEWKRGQCFEQGWWFRGARSPKQTLDPHPVLGNGERNRRDLGCVSLKIGVLSCGLRAEMATSVFILCEFLCVCVRCVCVHACANMSCLLSRGMAMACVKF